MCLGLKAGNDDLLGTVLDDNKKDIPIHEELEPCVVTVLFVVPRHEVAVIDARTTLFGFQKPLVYFIVDLLSVFFDGEFDFDLQRLTIRAPCFPTLL